MELYDACRLGDISTVKFCIERGDDINKSTMPNCWTGDWNCLAIAAMRGNFDVVEYLLDHGIEIDIAGPSGFTAAMMAVWHNKQYDIARLLLDRGSDPNHRSKCGKDFLQCIDDEEMKIEMEGFITSLKHIKGSDE